ncbi:MAG: GNAT family N-acetyltransferase [Tenericutes bacterium HGW-Tenericutes-8]|nr:MAG: GNAT family N-acetyltransferase [Tenericutes bacterium HGW-Tenericutes-8]
MIRLATLNDLKALQEIYAHGRDFIRSYQSPQWQNNYPSEALTLDDIEKKALYVYLYENQIVGVMTVFDYESTYDVIEGAWVSNKPYKVIHRIATHKDYYQRGIAAKMMDYVFCELGAISIRIDTHALNIPMQKMLLKNGFSYCGIIYLNTIDDRIRLAYQKDI